MAHQDPHTLGDGRDAAEKVNVSAARHSQLLRGSGARRALPPADRRRHSPGWDSQRPRRGGTALALSGPSGWEGDEGSPAGPRSIAGDSALQRCGRRSDLLRVAGQPCSVKTSDIFLILFSCTYFFTPPRTFLYSKRTATAEYKKVELSSSDDLPTRADSLIMAPQMSLSC